jgi:predicted nucleic acid-binding protein
MRSEFINVIGRSSMSIALQRVAADRQQAITLISAKFDRLVMLEAEPSPTAGENQLLCSDPDDQVFLDLAVTRGASFLLSRDRALLKLARRANFLFNLSILTPDQFTEVMDARTTGV